MRAGQRLVASDGYQVALFPLTCLYMSQDEGGNYSHVGTYNVDFLGYRNTGSSYERVYNAPIYAPCDCKCVYLENTYGSGNLRVFQSIDKVHTPSGLKYIHFYFAHDNNPVATYVGQTFSQGDLIAHTGTYGNVTGDHTHTCMGEGQWVNWSTNITNRPPQNHQDLTYRLHYWDAVYVNDTDILRGFGHDWVTYSGGNLPFIRRKGLFPWVLFARKLREKNFKMSSKN